MDPSELCGDILQPGGQLETPGLVNFVFHLIYPNLLYINYFFPYMNIDTSKIFLIGLQFKFNRKRKKPLLK